MNVSDDDESAVSGIAAAATAAAAARSTHTRADDAREHAHALADVHSKPADWGALMRGLRFALACAEQAQQAAQAHERALQLRVQALERRCAFLKDELARSRHRLALVHAAEAEQQRRSASLGSALPVQHARDSSSPAAVAGTAPSVRELEEQCTLQSELIVQLEQRLRARDSALVDVRGELRDAHALVGELEAGARMPSAIRGLESRLQQLERVAVRERTHATLLERRVREYRGRLGLAEDDYGDDEIELDDSQSAALAAAPAPALAAAATVSVPALALHRPLPSPSAGADGTRRRPVNVLEGSVEMGTAAPTGSAAAVPRAASPVAPASAPAQVTTAMPAPPSKRAAIATMFYGRAPSVAPSSGGAGASSSAPGARDNWVQCARCRKWRRLPAICDMSALPERWYCFFNRWDATRNRCTAPEDRDAALRMVQ